MDTQGCKLEAVELRSDEKDPTTFFHSPLLFKPQLTLYVCKTPIIVITRLISLSCCIFGLNCLVNKTQWLSQEPLRSGLVSEAPDQQLLDHNSCAKLHGVDMPVEVTGLLKQEVMPCGKRLMDSKLINFVVDDVIRAAGAIAITVPSCWFILSNSPDTSHGHGGHGGHDDSHGKEHEEEAKEESADDAETEEKPDEGAEKEDDSDKSEDSDSGDEKEADTPETSDNESEKSEAKDAGKNTKTHIPDAKGGAKNRLESKAAIKAGELKDDGNADGPSDKVCRENLL